MTWNYFGVVLFLLLMEVWNMGYFLGNGAMLHGPSGRQSASVDRMDQLAIEN